jgi:tetratricopeptide (TPR) repeat protein
MSQQPTLQSETLSSPVGQLWKTAREGPRAAIAWAAAHRLRVMLIAGGGLLLIGGAAVGLTLMAARRQAEEPITLGMALGALDRGDFTAARQLAEKLSQQKALSLEEESGVPLILGAAAAYQADDAWRQQKQKAGQYLAASRYLQQADRSGFPPGREAEGLFLLGKCLYLAGQIPASRPVLQEALQVNKTKQSELHWLLGSAYMNDAYPKLDQALAENALFLSDPLLAPKLRNQGLLQRAQILLRQKNMGECIATLDKIPQDSENLAEALVIRAQILMEEARLLRDKPESIPDAQNQIRDKYLSAIQILHTAESRDTLSAQATRKTRYLVGLCYLETNDLPAALDQFQQTRTLFIDSPEGAASNYQEAEVLRTTGREAEAFSAYRRVLASVGSPENYNNPWIALEQLRAGILTALKHYLGARDFELGAQLARLTHPLFPREKMLELTADVYQSWGQALMSEAEQQPPGKAESLRRRAAAEFRQAGHFYWSLSKLQLASREYPDILWNSANAYMAGQDYRNAIPILQKYLLNESRRRRPQALVFLGEALLATDQTDKALEAFQDCIKDHGRDAAAHRARLLAAKTCLEKGDSQQAEALLRANLASEYLTPESKEWRDSLFALGELLHGQGRYREAIVRLEEALERYPDSPRATSARYDAADCYRSLAGAAQNVDAGNSSQSDAGRSSANSAYFQQALAHYQALEERLVSRRKIEELTPLENSLLRNTYFALGGILFDLGRHEESLRAYSALINRYQNQPETLEAYVQASAVYRQLNKIAEARSALEQAKMALAQIKNDAALNETTNFDRKQWSNRLEELMKL